MSVKVVDVYPYCKEGGVLKFLFLKRSSSKVYANQWRMVGGKINFGEKAWQAALRELREETGIDPKLFWTIPSVNQFYEWQTDTVHQIPAFAAECTKDQPIHLNDEHSEYTWLTIDEVPQYCSWPEQIRLVRCLHHLISQEILLPQWIIPIVE